MNSRLQPSFEVDESNYFKTLMTKEYLELLILSDKKKKKKTSCSKSIKVGAENNFVGSGSVSFSAGRWKCAPTSTKSASVGLVTLRRLG